MIINMAVAEVFFTIQIILALLVGNKKKMDIRIKFIYPMLGVLLGTEIAMIIKLV